MGWWVGVLLQQRCRANWVVGQIHRRPPSRTLLQHVGNVCCLRWRWQQRSQWLRSRGSQRLWGCTTPIHQHESRTIIPHYTTTQVSSSREGGIVENQSHFEIQIPAHQLNWCCRRFEVAWVLPHGTWLRQRYWEFYGSASIINLVSE